MAINYTKEEFWLQHALDVAAALLEVDRISVEQKEKDLLKFGTHTAVGTGWETMAEMQDSETEETFVTDNDITHVASTSAADAGKTLNLEYHILNADGTTTFGVQPVTLDGSDGRTPVALTTPAFRTNRAYNTGSTLLVGAIAFYEGGAVTAGKPDNDDQVHLLIPAGEQQTQKAATTISGTDVMIVTNLSVSVLSKTAAYAEARLEFKPVSSPIWRPISQNFSCKDSSGTVQLNKKPYLIIPSDHDVRLASKANTAGVAMAGGFNGILATTNITEGTQQ